MPIIIRTSGSIPESLIKYLNNILGKHDIKETEKTAILDAHCTQTDISKGK